MRREEVSREREREERARVAGRVDQEEKKDFKLLDGERASERARDGSSHDGAARGGVSAAAYLATLCILRCPRQEHEQFTAG